MQGSKPTHSLLKEQRLHISCNVLLVSGTGAAHALNKPGVGVREKPLPILAGRRDIVTVMAILIVSLGGGASCGVVWIGWACGHAWEGFSLLGYLR